MLEELEDWSRFAASSPFGLHSPLDPDQLPPSWDPGRLKSASAGTRMRTWTCAQQVESSLIRAGRLQVGGSDQLLHSSRHLPCQYQLFLHHHFIFFSFTLLCTSDAHSALTGASRCAFTPFAAPGLLLFALSSAERERSSRHAESLIPHLAWKLRPSL